MELLIDYELLRSALKKYNANNSYEELGRLSGVKGPTISRIASGVTRQPSLQTWNALHQAAPLFIPPPPISGMTKEPSAEMVERGAMRWVPVFHAGAGPDCWWDDGGYPVGESDQYMQVPVTESDEYSFAVKVHGNSMAPAIEDGDLALVVPSRELQHGKACFVTNQHEQIGERLIRRYFKYGQVVVLKPDNPAAGFEIQLTPENCEEYRVYRVTKVEKHNP